MIYALSLAVAFWHTANQSWNDVRMSPAALVNGTAYAPFIYRVLTPTLLNIVGGDIKLTTLLINVAYVLILVATMQRLTPTRPSWQIVLGLLFFSAQNNLYDYTTVATFALCYYAMSKKRWLLYLAAFAVATLAKETTALLIVLYVVWSFNQGTFKGEILYSQVALYVIIQGAIRLAYAHATGAAYEWHLTNNLELWATHGETIPFITLLVLYLTHLKNNWRRLTPFTLSGLGAVALPIAISYPFIGHAYEIRMFYEAYPLFWLSHDPLPSKTTTTA